MDVIKGFFALHWLDLVVIAAGVCLSILLERKYKSTRYVSFINYIPSVWTSLGILGTFISIYFSLTGLDFGSLQDISSLVTKVAPAFSTSIIGIIGALFYSIKNRWTRADEEVNEERSYFNALRNIDEQVTAMGAGAKEVAREMGREMVAAAGEEWRRSLREHVAAMARVLEDEKEEFKRVSVEIVSNLQAVASAHKESMKTLLDSYEKEANSVKASCQQSLKVLADEYTEQFKKIAEYHSEHLSELDQHVRESVEGAYKDLAANVKECSDSLSLVSIQLNVVQAGLKEAGEAATSAGASFTQAKSDIDSVRKEALSVMTETKSHLEEKERKITELLKITENVTSNMKDLVDSASSAVTKASQMVDRVDSKVRSQRSSLGQKSKPSSSSPSQGAVMKSESVAPHRRSGLGVNIKKWFFSKK